MIIPGCVHRVDTDTSTGCTVCGVPTVEQSRLIRALAKIPSKAQKVQDERDQLIRQAFAANVTVTQIALAAGLSRQGIYNILDKESQS